MRDLSKWKARAFSWSQISSWEFERDGREQWYQSYILGVRKFSREMTLGSQIGKKIETDPTYLPMIPRYSKMEHKFEVVFNKIPMVGYADSFCDRTFKKLLEIKTGKRGTYEWTQEKVDKHGQIDMYLLMNYITNKISPEDVDITLVWLPTAENNDFTVTLIEPVVPVFFKTKRTMQQILEFGSRVNKVYAAMEKYAQEHE